MVWCSQATSHYLSQCLPSFMSPYGITVRWLAYIFTINVCDIYLTKIFVLYIAHMVSLSFLADDEEVYYNVVYGSTCKWILESWCEIWHWEYNSALLLLQAVWCPLQLNIYPKWPEIVFCRRQHHFDSNQRTCNMTGKFIVIPCGSRLTLVREEFLTKPLI